MVGTVCMTRPLKLMHPATLIVVVRHVLLIGCRPRRLRTQPEWGRRRCDLGHTSRDVLLAMSSSTTLPD